MKILHALPVLVLAATITSASAQRLAVGPRVGVNFASFSTDALNNTEESKDAAKAYEEDRRGLAGAQVGLITNYMVNENFSFQPEFLFSAKGFKQEGSLPAGPIGIPAKYEYKTIMNYLEVPLLLKGSIGRDGRYISILGGPYVGYLLGGRTVLKEAGQEIFKEKLNFDYDKGEMSKFQRFDAGAAIGASASYRASVGTFMIDVRYNYGLTNVFEYNTSAEDYDPNAGVKIYNRTFGVSFGYVYHIGSGDNFKPKPRPELQDQPGEIAPQPRP